MYSILTRTLLLSLHLFLIFPRNTAIRSPLLGLLVLGMSFSRTEAQTVKSETTQTKPAAPVVAEKIVRPVTSPEVKELIKFWSLGRYDDLIERATQIMAEAKTPDPMVAYWRGYAEKKISWLDAALKDLKPLGEYAAWPKYPLASSMVNDIEEALAHRPPLEYAMKIDGVVVFRVYFRNNDDFTRNIMDSLPQGYEVATRFVHKKATEIPVFIFNEGEYDDFYKFMMAFSGVPHKWHKVLAAHGAIIIGQRSGYDKVTAGDIKTMPNTIGHEMTHVLMRRQLAKVKDTPTWFIEGTAQMVAATLSPEQFLANDQRIKRLVQQNALLPLEQLTKYQDFHGNVDQQQEGTTKANPYAQGMSMTRYLGFILKGGKLSDFLDMMEKKGDFEGALKELSGMTYQEFFDSWLAAVSKK
jgi:hypothetical protein